MALSRRFLIAYVLLVGVPFALLLGVLHFGRNLAAPFSVQGIWGFTENSVDLALSGCQRDSARTDLPMYISQSGQHVVIEFQPLLKTAAVGEIQGTELTAATPSRAHSAVTSACDASQTYSLTATVDPKAQPPTIAGIFHLDGCASCPPIPFRAIRKRAARGDR